MKLIHYYHIYADGHWQAPVTEHIQALNESGLMEALDSIRVGIIGSEYNRKLVKDMLPSKFTVVVEALRGYEQVTMEAFDISEPCKVFYAHTKGASNPDRLRILWRESMTNACVLGWEKCIRLLDEGYSATGCYWRDLPQQHFSGTYWWATSEYINSLPPPLHNTRFDAEMWIGQGTIGSKIADLCPGLVHPLNIIKRTDFIAGGTTEVPGEVTFITNTKIAGFIGKYPHTARLTPFIQNCIDKGHFTVISRGASFVKPFKIWRVR